MLPVTTLEQILGAWVLVDWRIEYQGKPQPTRPFGEQPIGLLLYDRSGWMSATMSSRKRTPFSAASAVSATAESKASALNEYLAYTGRWYLESSVLVHTVLTSLNPVLVGTEQRRNATLKDGQLELTAVEYEQRNGQPRERLHRIVWKRD